MRFAISFLYWALLPATALADPGQVYQLGEAEKAQIPSVKINFQNRAGNAVPQTIDGLSVDAMASGLGNIAAIAIGLDGTIILVEQEKGRVLRLEDRGQDGKIDARRIIASGLLNPSGLATHGDTIYVADDTAIWQVGSKGGTMTEFVSLRMTNSVGASQPLLMDIENDRLVIGLTDNEGTAKVIGVDMTTRRASLIASGSGQLTALAKPKKGPLWAGLDGALIPVSAGQALDIQAGQPLEAGTEVSALMLPGQFELFTDFPETLSGHILAAQGGDIRLHGRSSGGLNIIAIPTVFGQPKSEFTVLVDGFTSSSGRTAWGRPAAMAMDARGLMIADPQSGTLWRVKADSITLQPIPKPVAVIEIEEETSSAKTEPKRSLGSSIENGSGIKDATTLNLGSTIIRDYEATEKAKAELEKSDNPERPEK